jgi:hypothetical protein
MKWLDVLKGRILLVILPVLGILTGFVLTVVLWPWAVNVPAKPAGPVVVAVSSRGDAGFFSNLMKDLRTTSRFQVVDKDLFSESLRAVDSNASDLAARRTTAQRFGAAILVTGQDLQTDNQARSGHVQVFAVDSGALLWEKYWQGSPLDVKTVREQMEKHVDSAPPPGSPTAPPLEPRGAPRFQASAWTVFDAKEQKCYSGCYILDTQTGKLWRSTDRVGGDSSSRPVVVNPDPLK